MFFRGTKNPIVLFQRNGEKEKKLDIWGLGRYSHELYPMSPNPTPNTTLPVMEAFYTLQGEGFHSGTAAYFIRLAGCDVGCVWCDVKESWEVEEHQWQPVENIVELALKYPSRIAVITGGEPCMYDLTLLTSQLKMAGFKVHIETSGAYPFVGTADWICVSPKKFMKPLPELLAMADELKVVVFNESDFQWAVEHAVQTKPGCFLFLQPEYGKSEKITPIIAEYVMNNPSWKISLQIHKFIGIP